MGFLVLWPAVGALAQIAEEVLDVTSVSPEQRQRLLRGEIVSYRVSEVMDKELAVGLAMWVPAPLGRIGELIVSSDLLLQDPGVSAHGVIRDGAGAKDIARFRFTAGEIAEAQELLDAAPGSRFNLSQREIEIIRAAKAMLRSGDRGAVLEAASAQYRSILLERWEAYRSGGLPAIEPYVRRGGGASDPGAELRTITSASTALVRALPELQEALLRYPESQLRQSVSQFYWAKRQIQGRPDPVLIHHLVELRPDVAVHVERHFYVGHSYNCSQIIAGGLPYGDGTVVFSANRVATDEVTGFGNDLKRSIGRRQLRAEIQRRFERIRAALAPPPRPPESP